MSEDHTRDATAFPAATDTSSVPLERGTKVYVRNRFLGEWSGGFEVAEILNDGYRLRRLSDGYVFPDVFAFEDVGRERRKDPLRHIARSYHDRRH